MTDTPHTPDGEDDPLPEVLVADEHAEHARLSRMRGQILSLTDRVHTLEQDMGGLQDTLQVVEGAGRRLLEHATDPAAGDTDGAGRADGDAGPVGPAAGADTGGGGDQAAAPPELGLRELVAWAAENVLAVVDRPNPMGKAPYWCPLWWRHPEAVSRLVAAHSSWAEAAASPVGNARVVYWEHLDHQLGVLMSEHGPFRRCGEDHDPAADHRGLAHLDPDEATYRDFENSQPTPSPGTPATSPAPGPAAGEPAGAAGGGPAVERSARKAPSETPAAGQNHHRPEHRRGR